MSASDLHTSVLLDEALEGLAVRGDGVYIDATCGLGGHTEALLDRSRPSGRVLSIDRDPAALEHARTRLAPFGDRACLVEGDFSSVGALARQHDHHPADGVLADLGVSSLQLDDGARGFSFRVAAPLDMRMGECVGGTAADLLNSLEVEGLTEILRTYGEVHKAGRIARAIIEARDADALETTADLARVVERAVGRHPRAKTHPATRVFQALRIAVNRELDELRAFLDALPDVVRPGGRVAIISFHSLEDRLVKNAFRDPPAAAMPRGLPVEPVRVEGPFRALTRKPITPSAEEVERNPRARSAKLRIAERRSVTRRPS